MFAAFLGITNFTPEQLTTLNEQLHGWSEYIQHEQNNSNPGTTPTSESNYTEVNASSTEGSRTEEVNPTGQKGTKENSSVLSPKNGSTVTYKENKDNETGNTKISGSEQPKNGESNGRIAEIALLTGATDESGKPSVQGTQPSKSEQEHLINVKDSALQQSNPQRNFGTQNIEDGRMEEISTILRGSVSKAKEAGSSVKFI